MGGHAFKDQSGAPTTGPIKATEVAPTVRWIASKLLVPIGVADVGVIGSAGKKPESGDIDLAIGPVPSEAGALKAYKENLLAGLGRILGEENVKLVGLSVTARIQIVGTDDRYVQVDFMPVSNVEHASWLMAGTGSGVKGVYRNLMISYLAKMRSTLEPGTKVTVQFPGGVKTVVDGKTEVPLSDDPRTILREIGITLPPSEVTTFEALVTHLSSDPVKQKWLQGYRKYIESYINNPSSAVEAEKAVAFIERLSGVKEESMTKHRTPVERMLKRLVGSIVTESLETDKAGQDLLAQKFRLSKNRSERPHRGYEVGDLTYTKLDGTPVTDEEFMVISGIKLYGQEHSIDRGPNPSDVRLSWISDSGD